MTPMWISIFQTVILRVPLAYAMCYFTRSAEYPIGRSECIFISLLVSWLIGCAVSVIFYARGKWRDKAIVQ